MKICMYVFFNRSHTQHKQCSPVFVSFVCVCVCVCVCLRKLYDNMHVCVV